MQIERVSMYNTPQNVHENLTNKLGKDEFLKILITQLRYQDPLSPLDDKDFIAQMAQFSILEGIQNLVRSFSMRNALTLVGKKIYAEKHLDSGAGNVSVEGKVESATFRDGKIYLRVGNYDILLDEVVKVCSD